VLLAGVVLAAAAGVVVAVAAGRDPPRSDRFDSGRAWAELRREVQLGPRPAGSAALQGLAERLRRELPHGSFESVPGHRGLRNVIGRLPGRHPAIVVAAHYDSKVLPDFVAANDGAGGTAAVMELARALRHVKRPASAPELRFVLFDGEEATDDTRRFEATGLRGSSAYARRHAGEIRALVLLDFVAAKRLRIRRESSSDPTLWSRLRHAAKAVGAEEAFPSGTGPAITDDHTPFLARGIPAIDLIQWPYACWHKPCDDLSAVSEHSLDQSGEAVFQLVRTLSR
jgi:hypothetical protein